MMLRSLLLRAAPLAALPALLQAQAPVTLTLGGAARLAAQQSAAAQIGRARIEQADAKIRQAKSFLYPTLSASAGENERNQNTSTFGFAFKDPTGKPVFPVNGMVLPPVTVYDLRGKAQASLLDLSVTSRLKAVRSQADVTGAEAAGASDLAAANAAAAYVRAVRADAVLAARLADSTLAVELLSIANEQLKAGVGVALDVTRAKSQVVSARAALIGARADRDRARLDLRRVIGLAPDAEVVLADSLASLADAPAVTADEATRTALSRRSEVRSATALVAATEQQLRATKMERLPTVGLYGDQGAIGNSTQHLLNTYTWGLAIQLPIFDGFRRDGRVQEQEAQVGEAKARRKDAEAQAAMDVRGALLDLSAARDQAGAAQERLALAQLELEQARDRFKAGVSGNADVITASLALNAARTQLVDARASYQAARVTLARAQGAVTDLP